jgi:predicted porin
MFLRVLTGGMGLAQRLFFGLVGLAVLAGGAARAADLPTTKPPAATPAAPSCLSSFQTWLQASAQACPLSYMGVTVYGQVDAGVGYSSHGANFNGAYPQGVQEVIAKYSQGGKYQFVPNGLSRSFIGVKGAWDIAAGWSVLFNASADFDPYSLQLANGPKSLVENNLNTLASQSANGDSSRAGQWDNTVGYIGLKNATYGALTVGRQNSLSADLVTDYDPMLGSYAFSLIGNSATYVSGVGDTETTRYNTSVRYQGGYGPIGVGAMWQFGGYDQGNGSDGAFQLGSTAKFGDLSLDGVYSYARDAVSLSNYGSDPLPKGVSPDDLKATLADIQGVVLAAKYQFDRLRLFGGYEYALFQPPSDAYPQGFTSLGGYNVLPGAVTTTTYDVNKILQVGWAGARYAILDNLDIAGAGYLAHQNNYNPAGSPSSYCAPSKTSQGAAHTTCSGDLWAVSALVDYRPVPRIDLYAGVLYSQASGGIASGYLNSWNIAPTAGIRTTF